MNTIYHLSVKNKKVGGIFFLLFSLKKGGELIRDDVFFCVCGFTVIIFVICFSTDYVTAKDVFNMADPLFSNNQDCSDNDYESSISSLISSVADSALVSSSHLCHHDEDDSEDYDDDESHGIEHDGPQVNGAANIATSQELKSADEQLHSLQSG